MLFVMIPLPVTGAYTGSVAAWLFNIPKKKAFVSVTLGVIISGIIVTIISLSGSEVFHFLIKKVYICGITATPENQRMTKTALGSTDSVDWEYMKEPKELINKLEKDNVIIVSVEQADQSIKIQDFKPVDGFDYAFVFGNEVDGVREEFIKASKHVLEIPQEGTKHSLNVSVAAGVILWDFYKKCGLDNT